MSQPMMPKATALWMIENTGLSFKQIADFCGLHELEVQALADGDVMSGMAPLDPVLSGQVTAEEIKRGESDPETRLRIVKNEIPQPLPRAKAIRAPKNDPSMLQAAIGKASCQRISPRQANTATAARLVAALITLAWTDAPTNSIPISQTLAKIRNVPVPGPKKPS